jgi:hypothetical protein
VIILKSIAVFLLLFVAGCMAYIRLAPSDPDLWHVDPMTAVRPAKPNSFMLRPGVGKYPTPEFSVSAQVLEQAFDAMVMGQPNVKRLAGSPADLWVTYIARTPIIGYPDYISVRYVPLTDGKSSLAVYSRARFGYGDKGVNRKRMLKWLDGFTPK